MTPATVLIANPAAGRGRGARRLPAVREALAARGPFAERVTQAPGEERLLAREAAAGGADTIIALGGDGTWGNVARGILDSGHDARLALLPAGTGNDFGHGVGLPMHDLDALIGIATGPTEVRIDLGLVDGEHFLNVVGIGIETVILAASTAIPILHGPAVYVAAALPKLVTFRSLPVAIRVDDGVARPWERVLAVICSNGPRFGGGFRVAPKASPSDGRLDLVTVGDASLLRRLALFARVRSGTHLAAREVRYEQVARAGVSTGAPPLLDLDGELVRARRAEIVLGCAPARLRIAVASR